MAGCKKLEVVSGPRLVLFADLKQIFPLNGCSLCLAVERSVCLQKYLKMDSLYRLR